jgi:DNA polymerase III alpha subunit
MSVSYPSSWDLLKNGEKITLEGKIIEATEVKDKKNQLMAFAQLETEYNQIKLVIFSDAYRPNHDLFQKGFKIKIKGKKDSGSLLVSKKDNIELIEGKFNKKAG